jgi:hypothetical protein
MKDLLLDGVGKARWYLDHVHRVRLETGTDFVFGPQRDKLAARDGGVGTHCVLERVKMRPR